MKRREIERLLPEIFQRTLHAEKHFRGEITFRRGSPLFAILKVMEDLHKPSEELLRTLDIFFDPQRTPDDFLPFLACWVNLDRIFEERSAVGRTTLSASQTLLSSGLGKLRQLTADAAFLSQWRGTKKGLLRFLEVATGVAGFEIDEQVIDSDGRPRPFHLRVRVPKAAESHQHLIRRIIDVEKPAYVNYELEFVPQEA